MKEWYKITELWRSLILPDHTEVISNHLADIIYTYGPMEKTMVFCVTQEHARLVAKTLQNRFSHLGFEDYAVTIISDDSEAKAMIIIISKTQKNKHL